MALVDVNPLKLVHVRVDEVWRDGLLRAWQKHDRHWRRYVTYSVGVGLKHVAWIDQDRLRHHAVL